MRQPLLLSLLMALASSVPAIAMDPLDDKKCLECHAGTDLTTRDPLTGREYMLAIDVPRYRHSVHGKLECRACHERGYAVVPHTSPRRRDPFQCLFCHRDDGALVGYRTMVRKEAVTRSVHREKVGDLFDCHACHDPHVFYERPPVEEGSARVAWANAICTRCHGPKEPLEPFGDAKKAATTHDFLPHTALHLRVTECVTCHGEPEALRHWIRPVEGSRRECTACHSQRAELLRDAYGGEKSALSDNAGLLDDVYVIGATRTGALDRWSQIGFAAAFAFIFLHALARLATRRRRDG
jgi:hypothetical protein